MVLTSQQKGNNLDQKNNIENEAQGDKRIENTGKSGRHETWQKFSTSK